MKELIEFLHTTWHQDVMTYQGYFALFLASLLYVYGLKKKNRLVRGYLGFSMGWILLFCFLPFTWICTRYLTGEGTYFHLLWALPVVQMIAYVFVHWMSRLKKVSQKIVWLVFALCLVWWAGSCVYWRADWSQNGYSTRNPDWEEQMEICLILDALDGDKTVIADDDFLPLLRQVSGSIHLLYGSDIVEDGAYPDEIQDLHNKMTAGMFDSQYLLNTASDLGANYMIVAPDVNAPMPRLDELESNGEIQILYITEHYTLVKF